jgi:alpha-amylase
MGVILQAFYWDCPRLDHKEFQWWSHVAGQIPALRKAGFTALWIPPASKAANLEGPSMGYDPYDYYDLGDIDQKGSIDTWFGSKDDLLRLIQTAHENEMLVFADLVINHCSGGDGKEVNPLDHQERWTRFTPKSGKFFRDSKCFHPSPYETWDDGTFGDMPDLCHRDPYVYTQILEYSRWLLEDIGFDGFRYDCVKGYGGWMIRAIQELRALRDGRAFKPFGVGECWDSDRVIGDWLDETNAWSDNPAGAFDFPLRDRLKDLCDSYGYSLKNLPAGGTLLTDRPLQAVTFVENHDVARSNPITQDKILAYAFILTHEGYPCVFWQDYFNWGLGKPETPNGIAALVRIHEDHAGGPTRVLYADNDLYVMQREGIDGQKGLVLVINNRGDWWGGGRVQTRWRNTRFVPAAWSGRYDSSMPEEKRSDREGVADFWAAPRGYAVYLPRE